MKILYRTLQVVSAIGVLGWFWLGSVIGGLPTQPDANTGHIMPLRNHGRIVYLTPFESFANEWAMPVFFIVIAAQALLGRHLKITPEPDPYEKLNEARRPKV